MAERNRAIWDLVLHLAHPALFYVLFLLGTLSRLGDALPWSDLHPLHPLPFAVYGAVFLGAWCVLYTTMLRDMGYRSPEGTVLLLTGLLGVVLAFAAVPRPRESEGAALAITGSLLVLAVAGWVSVMLRWRRLKSRYLASEAFEPETGSR